RVGGGVVVPAAERRLRLGEVLRRRLVVLRARHARRPDPERERQQRDGRSPPAPPAPPPAGPPQGGFAFDRSRPHFRASDERAGAAAPATRRNLHPFGHPRKNRKPPGRSLPRKRAAASCTLRAPWPPRARRWIAS